MKWRGEYDVYNNKGQHLYTVPDYEAKSEVHSWEERGYNATIDDDKYIIEIGEKK